MQSPRFIFIHGNSTEHWSFAWAPWLKGELERRGFETFFETMPDPVIARAEYWLPFLEHHAKAGEHDVLVGWSSGAVAAMRYAEKHKIAGSILISPCYTDLGDDLEKQSGYYNDPWRWDSIRANQQNIALFYSDDDPFIPQAEFAYIGDRLKPEVRKISGAGHFIDRQEFPELMAYVDKTYPSPQAQAPIQYPNNDLWSVRQIEFLRDALDGYEGKSAIYYPGKEVSLSIPGVAMYQYVGVLHFPGQDRTIIFEQGDGFGLKKEEILAYLRQKNIRVEERG